jgi:hypothetical protein
VRTRAATIVDALPEETRHACEDCAHCHETRSGGRWYCDEGLANPGSILRADSGTLSPALLRLRRCPMWAARREVCRR